MDDLPDGPHRALFELWSTKRQPGRLPSRSDFDPTQMRALLPHITLFDVEREPLRIRVRLVGTAIVEAMGTDTTGRYLDELPNIEHVLQRAKAMAGTGQPYFLSDLPVTWTHRTFKRYSVLGVPLAADGRTVDKLLYTMVFE